MSFLLLRRQQSRLSEVAESGTYDSVLQAVENAATARSFTDEGTKFNRSAKNTQRVWSDPQDQQQQKSNPKQEKKEASDKPKNNNNIARAAKKNTNASTEKEMLLQHHGSISLNEKIARKVADARLAGDAKKNIQDNQRRFLNSRMKPENAKFVRAAQQQAAHFMRRKNESGDPMNFKKKKPVVNNNKKKGKKAL
jgi:hypothetical protein